MISYNARNGFERLFVKAIKSSLVASAEDSCDVDVLSDPSEIKETKIVMLTVSSYLFRLVIMIYFTPDGATREHYAKLVNSSAAEMNDQAFHDAIAESGNMCCGLLNRDLGEIFSHIGMSTPSVIDKNCAAYIASLKCGHVRHFKIKVADMATFHASLCVCDFADLDFVVESNEEASNTGELEIF